MYTNVQTLQFQGDTTAETSSSFGRHHANIGGVTTYNVPSGNEAQLVRTPSIQAGVGGVLTIGADGSQQRSSAIHEVSTADLHGVQSGFLATARNNGMPAMGQLTPESVVNFHGMEVSLATLEAMGEVRRTPYGYEVAGANPGTGNQVAPSLAETQPPRLPNGVELLPEQIETEVTKAIDPFPQDLYNAAMARALEGGLDTINFNELAFASNMTPAEARQRAEVVLNAFIRQADEIATRAGVENPAEVWEWAERERPEEFGRARRELIFGRNTNGLKALVSDYFGSEAPSIEALQRAGIVTRRGTNGETLALIRGVWTTPAAAAKAGLI